MPRLSVILILLTVSLSIDASCPDAPTFTPGHYASSSDTPIVGFIRDVNGDGRGDLVVFYNTGAGFQVYLGTATGTLQPTPVQFNQNNEPLSSLAAADVNNDGKIDVIAGVGSLVTVYYGTGTGLFTQGPSLNMAGCGAIALGSGDFDGDGRLDVAALSVCGHLYIFRQTSPGTFAAPTDTPVGFPNGMDIGDLDGDGHLDVVVTGGDNTGAMKVFTLFGTGDGQFVAATPIELGTEFLRIAESVAIHDFNGDGRPDLAVAIVNRGVQILTNSGKRTFATGPLLQPEGGSVKVADFNYDGIADVFASGYGGFYIVLGNGDGTFRPAQFTAVPPLGMCPNCTRRPYVLGDLRGLNRVDVATTTPEFPAPQTIEVDLNDCGPPPVLTSVVPSSGAATGGNTVDLRGANFFSPQQVLFGSTPATITSSTPTVVTVVVPAHSPAVVTVSITTPDGTATLNNAYTFVGPTTTTIQVAPFIAASRSYVLTATITPAASSGTVTFAIDGVSVGTANVSGGIATLGAIAPAMLGTHTITAQFSGASIFGPSSATATVNVAADIPLLSPLAMILFAVVLAVSGSLATRS